MESQLKEFTTTTSSDNKLTIGFSNNLEGYVVAVVPRFWFPKNIPVGFVDNSKILIVPDKGSRTFVSSNIPASDFKNKNGYWVTISNRTLTSSQPQPTEQSEHESKLVHALFNLIHQKPNYDPANDPFFSISSDSTDFTTFLFKAIIETVNQEMRELRRSYNEIKVQSSTIRGRIDFSASFPLIASNSPELVCISEEFSLRAPHYSALMTAFDYIASYRSTDDANSLLAPILARITQETTVTRAKFREVPSFPHGIAVRTLRTTPLPPPLRKWSAIFGFALMVLEGTGTNIDAGQSVNNTATWEGDKLWENVLERVAERAFPNLLYTQNNLKMHNPWHTGGDSLSKKKPDIVISDDDYDIVIDAKYYDDLNSVMSGSSNYQMLGYALSAIALGSQSVPKRVGPRTVAFAVPIRKGENATSKWHEVHANPKFKYNMQLPFTILANEADLKPPLGKPPVLQGLEIEFPSVDVYLDENLWKDYYERVSKSFRDVVSGFIQDLEDHPVKT
jgi:5-methylcytosine-specific restriction endonuclease McrBC regulatory subunit McrC